MLQKDLNLSEVLEYYKKNKISSFDEDIDQFGDYFITAGRIASVILSATPVAAITAFCSGIDAASLRASKLLSWLPDKFKYKEKGREKFAIDRYELAGVINFMLLQIAIKNGVKDIIMPALSTVMGHVTFQEADQKELEKIVKECDKETESLKVPSHCSLTKVDFENYANKIIDPILSAIIKLINKCKDEKPVLNKIDFSKIKEKYLEKIITYHNAFIINFSGEFPEFALWSEVEQKGNIIKELKELSKKLEGNDKKVHDKFVKTTEQLIKRIEELRNSEFISENGFPSFRDSYKELFQLQTDKLVNSLTSKIRDNIEAHHNKIKSELNKPLIDNQDIEGIIYPKNKDIYIAQSFQTIIYNKKQHKKGFLTTTSLSEAGQKGENIGNYLLQTLIDPNSATRPIILLGNPGAGKSMLSKMFAGQLCETNDFIPFLIKLRSVASSTANISEHINKGLSKSIENSSDINWLDWAKEFKNRIPVIIMDGFDELMQSSNTELNNYINTIKEFQETALNHGICVRVILTSRRTVMQDVYIPEGSRILILDSFDQKRRDLWVKIWNQNQTKENYKFLIPKNEKIEHLAQEPLLMFMLAVYDFEKSELQRMTKNKSFNQSRLYDSLLNSFIERQLKKNELYSNAKANQQRKEEELFRLRLGMIAIMMFLNDSTHKDTQKLHGELEAFGLHESNIQTDNVLGGFFFIHENKSTTEGELEKLNYEFLHKTFGEFLAADFLLRVALKQCERSRDKICQKYIFKFCFGYNWLHKHNNIQNFLFEHAQHLIKCDSNERDIIVNDIIKQDLEALFENGNIDFPVKENQIQPHKQVVEHLGIYSQNLIFLWLAISKDNDEVKFEIFDSEEKIGDSIGEPKYESQDRNETNKNKLLWKRLAKLWTLVGNYNATAKLSEWVKVIEKENDILLSKQETGVRHNFSDSSKVSCNDFELLLSYFDNEFKFIEGNSLLVIENIVRKKPELTSLAIDVLLYRFNDLFPDFGTELLSWFGNCELSKRQQVSVMKKISSLKWSIPSSILVDTWRFVSSDMNFIYRENPQAMVEYMKIMLDLKSFYPLTELINQNLFEEAFHRISRDFTYIENDNPLIIIEYTKLLNELNMYYPYRRKFKGDYIEEWSHRLTSDIHHIIRDRPHLALDYLKLLNDLRKNYPIGRRVSSDFFEKSLHQLSKDIKYLANESPYAILEFLKLVYDLRKHSHGRKRLSSDFLEIAFKYFIGQWELALRDDYFSLIEYVKVTVGLNRYYAIEKLIPQYLIEESFSRLSKDLYYSLRDQPRHSNEYFQVIKDLIDFFPETESFTLRIDNILDELVDRLNGDFERVTSGASTVMICYLDLLLISISKRGSRLAYSNLERLIEMFSRRNFSIKIIHKVTITLLKYKADERLIERLLDKHLPLKHIYLNSPQLAQNILEAISEIVTDEKHN